MRYQVYCCAGYMAASYIDSDCCILHFCGKNKTLAIQAQKKPAFGI
jgi:hypothetical protein